MTYTISRYPVHLIDVMAAGARRITMRPMLPQDVELQQAFFRSLSDRARYNRFLTPVRELPPAMVARSASVDYSSHLALLAAVFEDNQERMIAEARYVVDPRDPTMCELAVAVADDWQRRGVASTLLDRLERQAAACGIQRITADTLATNGAMIALARRRGYAIAPNPGDATLARLEKVLAPPTAAAAHSGRAMAA